MYLPDQSRSDGPNSSGDDLHGRPRVGMGGSLHGLPPAPLDLPVSNMLRERRRKRAGANVEAALAPALPSSLLQGGAIVGAMTTLKMADAFRQLLESVTRLKADKFACATVETEVVEDLFDKVLEDMSHFHHHGDMAVTPYEEACLLHS
jgi:hypothetical protein